MPKKTMAKKTLPKKTMAKKTMPKKIMPKKKTNNDSDSDSEYQEDVIFEKNETIFENEFYLYQEVSEDSCKQLIQFLRSREKEWRLVLSQMSDLVASAEMQPIKIYINSPGGDLHAMLPVIDYLVSMRGRIPIHTYVEGMAASAASLLASVGHERFCSRNSFLLIHELRTQMRGTYSNCQDEQLNCDKLMEHIKQIYLKASNGKLSTDKLDSLLKQDLLLSAEECLELGLIDSIIG